MIFNLATQADLNKLTQHESTDVVSLTILIKTIHDATDLLKSEVDQHAVTLASLEATAAQLKADEATIATLTAAIAQLKAAAPQPPAAPSRLLGVFTGGVDALGVDAFEKWLGRCDYAVVFGGSADWNDFVGNPGWTLGQWPVTRKLLWSQPLIAAGGNLADAAAGKYDDSYTKVATALASAAARIMAVRIGWEFNGDWYPWSIHKGAPADYAVAFRRFALIIRAAMPGVKFDWCANWDQMSPDTAYPGDDVVDFVSMDVYENSQWVTGDPAARWNRFLHSAVGTDLTTLAANAAAHSKPIGIPEYASNYDDGAFVANMATWIKANNVAHHSWWDSTSNFDGSFANHPTNQAAYLAAWK